MENPPSLSGRTRLGNWLKLNSRENLFPLIWDEIVNVIRAYKEEDGRFNKAQIRTIILPLQESLHSEQ